jgi:hypothetical protein
VRQELVDTVGAIGSDAAVADHQRLGRVHPTASTTTCGDWSRWRAARIDAADGGHHTTARRGKRVRLRYRRGSRADNATVRAWSAHAAHDRTRLQQNIGSAARSPR